MPHDTIATGGEGSNHRSHDRRSTIRSPNSLFIKGGQIVGATDEIGLHAVEKPYHFRDIHATLLHQHRLTYPHLGRNERLTFQERNLIEEVI